MRVEETTICIGLTTKKDSYSFALPNAAQNFIEWKTICLDIIYDLHVLVSGASRTRMVVVYVSNFYCNVPATHWQIRFDCRKYKKSGYTFTSTHCSEFKKQQYLYVWRRGRVLNFSFALANAAHENIKWKIVWVEIIYDFACTRLSSAFKNPHECGSHFKLPLQRSCYLWLAHLVL